MTESQISCFTSVAELGSFSKAASRLMISQPAVSHHISKLERELDILLFDRVGHEIYLTEAGTLMLDVITRIKSEFFNTLEAARALQNVFSGKVRLGFPDGWDSEVFLVDMLNTFQKEYPNVQIELVSIPLGSIEDAVQNGEIDVAITMQYTMGKYKSVSTHPLLSIHSVLLYSKKFRFEHNNEVTLADFKTCTFYLATDGNIQPFRRSVEQECAKYGFAPNMVNCANLSTALLHVQNNQGVFLGSELVLANQIGHVYSQLRLDGIQRPVVLAWRRDADAQPVKLFINETLYSGNIVKAQPSNREGSAAEADS